MQNRDVQTGREKKFPPSRLLEMKKYQFFH